MNLPMELAKIVRDAAEREFYQAPQLQNRCLAVSHVFAGVLRQADIKCKLVGGYYQTAPSPNVRLRFGDIDHIRKVRAAFTADHCWVEIGEQIWDLTATQFDSSAEKVAVYSKPDERYVERVSYPDDQHSEEIQFAITLIGADDLVFKLMRRLARTFDKVTPIAVGGAIAKTKRVEEKRA